MTPLDREVEMASFFLQHLNITLKSVLVIGFAVFFISGSNNYTLGKGGASATCLHARAFLIDHSDTDLEYDQLVAFTQNIPLDFMPESVGEIWVKILAAKAGDVVHVDLDGVTVMRADGVSKYYPLNARRVMASLDWQDQVERKWHLMEGEMFVIGETESSFDSRFWGPARVEDIQGASYAIY
ncbi:S26 family signal peptidase [Aliidiomarina quisquiliarum]|uniref:S26 family signal peptidase n=1 Tax=Aliidiomarina quisquiliarum TaxID=2938947 RepID=UPI00208ECC1B|nr:S26 family signal peptidase [Aliidiomarina quisquiliarum]MCO4319947.1 S26 family signal peptidase [Aliidiomarina quisquiliarum]